MSETGTETSRNGVLYPNMYAAYILLSSLDIVMTTVVIHYHYAVEVNTLASKAIDLMGHWGLIGLKFATVVVVVLVCEHVGRRRPATGRRVAEWAVAVSSVPVVVTAWQIARQMMH